MKPTSQYRHTFFRLNSGYIWGQGWTLTAEQDKQYRDDCRKLAKLLDENFIICPSRGAYDTCVQCVNKDGEYLYFHPMNISGTVLVENIYKFTEIVANFKSTFFSLREVDSFAIEENCERNTSSWHHEPKNILSQYKDILEKA